MEEKKMIQKFFEDGQATEVQISYFDGLYSVQVWRANEVSGAYQTLIGAGHEADLNDALTAALHSLRQRTEQE